MKTIKLQMRIHGVAGAMLVSLLLSACGSTSGMSAAAPSGPATNSKPPPVVITGLAMPGTVSVVTATNAN